MKQLEHGIAIVLLILGLSLAGCSGGSSRTDAGWDADATVDPDGDGDGEQHDGDPADAADEETVLLEVEAIIPSRGPVEGGTWVNFIGSGFVRGIADSPWNVEDDTEVIFGDNPAIDIEVIRDDMIGVRTPAGVAGPVDVTVENPNGRVIVQAAFTYFEAVTAFEVDPEHLSSRGGTPFTVEGTGFTPDTTVLVAGRPASSVEVESATRVHAVAPPAAPGPADVEVINRNGRALLFRAVTFHPVPCLATVVPAAGPEVGGTLVVAEGEGFEEGVDLLFGGTPASDLSCPAPDRLEATSPAGSGTVDVTVAGPVDASTLWGGFVFLPEPGGSLAVLGVAPSAGPTEGGQRVTVVGEGFAGGVDEVLFGSDAAVDVQDLGDRMLSVTTPPGEAGALPVTVRIGAATAVLENAYRFFVPVRAESIEPASGPAEGGTAFTIHGSGFHDGIEISFGGVSTQSIDIVSDTQVAGVTPPGTPGPVDVLIRNADSEHALPGAFSYTTELSLLRVHPDFGAMAGGTHVVCYGAGFEQDMRIWFGEREGGEIEVLSSSALTVRTPRGDPGEVTVAIERQGERFELPAGFSYFDPTNDRGGASGGPIQGSFNVTVLDGDLENYGAPIPDATVIIEDPPLSGTTDDRGQITFSGPSLVRAVTVTVGMEGYEAITVADLNAANLTVYLFPSGGEPSMGDQPGCEHWGIISGRVFGFKDIPSLPSGPDISLQARVNLAAKSIYSLPPYAPDPGGLVIEEDGGEFEGAVCFGTYTLYAIFGAFDSNTENFTPALMGLRRDIQMNRENCEPSCYMGGCDAGWGDCNAHPADGCETDLTANEHCGTCDNACTQPDFCRQGECVDQCPDGTTNCGGVCADLDTDPLNCGGCGVVCSFNHASADCLAGGCSMGVCNAGWVDCNNDSADGCEADMTSDANCGNCGEACAYREFCWKGGCIDHCPEDLTRCGDVCTDLEIDPLNCGGCGVACSFAHASAYCLLEYKDLDIVLGTYLDQSVPVLFQEPPLGTPDTDALYEVYAHLDLGQDGGYIYLAQDEGAEVELLLEGLPAATSNSFVFVGLASLGGGYPLSYTFRRPEGDVGDGVTLGPFLGFTEIIRPYYVGALSGPIEWSVEGPQPELIEMILQTATLPPSTLWRMVLPGDATEVTLPEEIIGLLPRDMPLFLIIFTADSPRFNFDRFNYSQLGTSYWTSYTVNYTVCTAP